ncbi:MULTISPECIES: hypothetical protein [unclassified Bradyrhizobium]|uniref:hypothetical protein n=1 Tax=unclassified Bradyrhizobium TaxID=2631580 RepID=UPI0028EDDDC1|nr:MULTISPECIES: hypothetical protein [unclassified Bradyrhizobium]
MDLILTVLGILAVACYFIFRKMSPKKVATVAPNSASVPFDTNSASAPAFAPGPVAQTGTSAAG